MILMALHIHLLSFQLANVQAQRGLIGSDGAMASVPRYPYEVIIYIHALDYLDQRHHHHHHDRSVVLNHLVCVAMASEMMTMIAPVLKTEIRRTDERRGNNTMLEAVKHPPAIPVPRPSIGHNFRASKAVNIRFRGT